MEFVLSAHHLPVACHGSHVPVPEGERKGVSRSILIIIYKWTVLWRQAALHLFRNEGMLNFLLGKWHIRRNHVSYSSPCRSSNSNDVQRMVTLEWTFSFFVLYLLLYCFSDPVVVWRTISFDTAVWGSRQRFSELFFFSYLLMPKRSLFTIQRRKEGLRTRLFLWVLHPWNRIVQIRWCYCNTAQLLLTL